MTDRHEETAREVLLWEGENDVVSCDAHGKFTCDRCSKAIARVAAALRAERKRTLEECAGVIDDAERAKWMTGGTGSLPTIARRIRALDGEGGK